MSNAHDRRPFLAGVLASLWLAAPFMNAVASGQILPCPTLDIHTHLDDWQDIS